MKLSIIGLSFLLLIVNFFNISIEKNPTYNKTELFDSSLLFLNTTQKLIDYADSCAARQFLSPDCLEYGIMVSLVIKKRFYHGFSVYNFRENWIAALAQFSVGKDLASPVKAEHILKYPFAGCSQQAIVLMEVMKQKGISYRSIGFPHHYALELNFKNNWYFFDPDMEPKIMDKERSEDFWNKSADSLKRFYSSTLTHLDWGFGKSQLVKIGKIDAEPAPNAYLFHLITNFFSKTLWIFPLFLIAFPNKKNRNLFIKKSC